MESSAGWLTGYWLERRPSQHSQPTRRPGERQREVSGLLQPAPARDNIGSCCEPSRTVSRDSAGTSAHLRALNLETRWDWL